ncbi:MULTISPECIES: YheC/YheD family protein [Paenibacillus]|uniref:Endospore coat-associated protein n=1 Tax=Paenibacillus borealis TaxID=160799 RepID=A0ABX3HNZ2_PAEBO|nr:YheC/YheD family protein [Paenibacillus borealis]OMD52520.1 endospore coat-associated protein [Paenibacillus borealis]
MLSKKAATTKKTITIASKWSKTKMLLNHSRLRQFVPDSRIYSYEALQSMLNKHKMVYVKPVKGTGGNGVIKVIKYSEHKYAYHVGETPRYFKTYGALFTSLGSSKLKREYLVQQGINLLTYQNRIFDVRIMTQMNSTNHWECTGYIGRMAHPKKIVTNFHNSGKPLPLETLLSPYLQGDKKKDYIKELKALGDQVAKEFHKNHSGFKEIGLDIGLDSALKPWIIEVNTRPDAYIFNQLKDKTMFRRVIYLKKWHKLLNSGKKVVK